MSGDPAGHDVPPAPIVSITPSIRAARRDDLGAIAAIERVAFTDAWSRASFAEVLAHPLSRMLVADDAGDVVGYIVARYVVDEAEIANLAVATTHRGRGIAARLLDTALDIGRGLGTTQVFLEVRDSNIAARALYAGRGFEELGRRARYYVRPVEDAIVMRKMLGAGG